jgi:hypothetical protein
MRSRFFNIAYISVHTPSEEKDDAVMDAFYEKLDNRYNQIPRNVTIILGDFSAKIGREELYKPIITD